MPATEGGLEPAQVARGRDGRQAQDVVAEQLPGESLDGRGVDRLDRGECLVECEDSVVERLLSADPRSDVARVVHAQLEAAGEVALRLLQLGVRHQLIAQAGELDEDRVEGGRQACRVDAGRDLQRSRVGIVDEPRRHVVGQPELLADRQEEPAAHAVAEDCVEDRQRPAVRVVPMEGRHAEAELRLARVALAGAHTRSGRQDRSRCETRDLAVAGPERRRRRGRPPRRVPGRRPPRRPCWPAGRPPARSRGSAASGGARMSASSPQISRPSGPSPNIAGWNRIWQYSDGSSRYERISSTITVRSLSMSASSRRGRTISSPMTSIARSASRRGTRTQ